VKQSVQPAVFGQEPLRYVRERFAAHAGVGNRYGAMTRLSSASLPMMWWR
jgi:hypothetical protein